MLQSLNEPNYEITTTLAYNYHNVPDAYVLIRFISPLVILEASIILGHHI